MTRKGEERREEQTILHESWRADEVQHSGKPEMRSSAVSNDGPKQQLETGHEKVKRPTA